MSAQPVEPILHISEVFGPTFQGEGPNTGRRCAFVRLGGCNLTCADCDTQYTWNAKLYDLREQITPTHVDDVLARLDAMTPRPALVVVSGGEPLLHQHTPGLRALMTALTADRGQRVQFETNGTLIPAAHLTANPAITYVVSPKLVGPLATDNPERRLVGPALAAWAALAITGRAAFKFVLSEPEQVDTVARFTRRSGIPADRVWVMPAGTTVDTVLTVGRQLADPTSAAGFNYCTRLHVLLWPKEDRGR
jgi:7-carboxy-7-deazaguanine synthase